MSIFSSIGRTMNKLPGMGAMTRPISNMMQKTPGMRGAPQALGMTPRPMPKPMGMGVGPSMGMMGQNMAQGGASVGNQMMPQQGPPQEMSPMPDVPMGDQAAGAYGQKPPQLYGGIGGQNQGQMGGFAGAMGNAMGQAGGRFGNMQKPMQGPPMNKMGRGQFKPQY